MSSEYNKLIEELNQLFPTPPLHERSAVDNVHEWMLNRGIEAGRREVIGYLMNLWGVAPATDPLLTDLNVPEPQNRIAADEYCRTGSSGP